MTMERDWLAHPIRPPKRTRQARVRAIGTAPDPRAPEIEGTEGPPAHSKPEEIIEWNKKRAAEITSAYQADLAQRVRAVLRSYNCHPNQDGWSWLAMQLAAEAGRLKIELPNLPPKKTKNSFRRFALRLALDLAQLPAKRLPSGLLPFRTALPSGNEGHAADVQFQRDAAVAESISDARTSGNPISRSEAFRQLHKRLDRNKALTFREGKPRKGGAAALEKDYLKRKREGRIFVEPGDPGAHTVTVYALPLSMKIATHLARILADLDRVALRLENRGK